MPKGQIHDARGQVLRLTGFAAADLTGRPPSQLFVRATPRELRSCLGLLVEWGRLEVTWNCRQKYGARFIATVVFTILWDVPEASGCRP
jgi:hypothetical protein